MTPSLRPSFLPLLTLPCLPLLLSACGAATASLEGDGGSGPSQSLSSPLSFPLGVETGCNAAFMELTANLSAGLGETAIASSPTVTLTSSGGVITATFAGTETPLAPVQFRAISGTAATVVAGQTWSVPLFNFAAPSSPNADALPIEGGAITFTGDTFFLALGMSIPGADGTVSAMFECTPAGKVPTDCACSLGEVCACSSKATPPLGVYTGCSTDVNEVPSADSEGGNTTVTLAEQNGLLTMTIGGGPNPVTVGSVDVTPTSAATATISGGQSLSGAIVPPTTSCTPTGDLWSQPEWPFAVESGSLATDGQWLTVSLVGTSPCAIAERVAILCPTRSP